jgi:hypothetical protein
MTGEPVKRQLQDHLGRARRPRPLALDTFQAFEKAADIEQHAGKFRSDTVERMTDALACGDDLSVKAPARSPRRPVEIWLAQFDVVRGIICARVNSARSRSPACN